MTDRIKLAEELEAAEGPSRELDQKIARAVGWTHFFVQKDMWWRPPAHLNRSATSDPPRFSASIDAAMTLVPEGWESIELRRTDDGEWHAALAGNDAHFMAEDPDEFFVESGNHATPALALCAAALKAGE